MLTEINVHQALIQQGVLNRASWPMTSATESCPIALAFNALGYQSRVCVDNVKLVKDGNFIGQIYLPAKAQLFIQQFDARKAVQPFTFEVWIP